jgi:sugar O-acyltransferase (sialic acid O-acetyltransferase NeuD family)
MLIAGAGNLGLHTLDQLLADEYKDEIVFFDEKNDLPEFLQGKYRLITTIEAAMDFFNQGQAKFVCAVGQPRIRERLSQRLKEAGGQLTSVVSKNLVFHSAFFSIGEGAILQPGCAISHNVTMGRSCLIHASSLIGHDVVIADYVTIGSMVNILKGVTIGEGSTISPNVLIYQNVNIGSRAYIAPGVIVTTNVADNQTLTL